MFFHGGVDPLGQPGRVFANLADYYACMVRLLPVQPPKIFPVECDHGHAARSGVVKHLIIRHSLAGKTGFLNRDDFMS